MIAQLNYATDNTNYLPEMPGNSNNGLFQSFGTAVNPDYLSFARNYLDPGIDNPSLNSPCLLPLQHDTGARPRPLCCSSLRRPHLRAACSISRPPGSWVGSPADGGYADGSFWMRLDNAVKVAGGGALCYDSVGWQQGTQAEVNNHGFMPDGTTRGGNVAFYDGHVLWEDDSHWTMQSPTEGTTYPNDHPAVRVWGTVNDPSHNYQWGYGPVGATFWNYYQFQPFFN